MSFNSTFMERSSSFRGYSWQSQQLSNLHFGLTASVSSSRLLVLELRGYTNMAPVYVSYQESSCLVYAWKVDNVTDLVRDGHTQFVCVCVCV